MLELVELKDHLQLQVQRINVCLALAVLRLHSTQQILHYFLLLRMWHFHQVTIVKKIHGRASFKQVLNDVDHALDLHGDATQISSLIDSGLAVGELIDRRVRLDVEVDVARAPNVIQKIVVHLDELVLSPVLVEAIPCLNQVLFELLKVF